VFLDRFKGVGAGEIAGARAGARVGARARAGAVLTKVPYSINLRLHPQRSGWWRRKFIFDGK